MNSDLSLRLLTRADVKPALALYSELTFGPPCTSDEAVISVLEHPGTEICGAFEDKTLVAMVTLHLLPNVTWDARPYGLIENVVTRGDKRKQGLGRAVMQFALDQAWSANAYKVMLLTGQKRGALGFYTSLGFSQEDKHGLVIRRA